MEFLGISFDVPHRAPLDPNFMPFGVFSRAFLKTATSPLAIAVEAPNGSVSVYETKVHGTKAMEEADVYYVERVVKCLLWMRGGYKITICGNDAIASAVAAAYSPSGTRSFDYGFMSRVYERPLEVISLSYDQKPSEKSLAKAVGRNLNGCRICFDAGGSECYHQFRTVRLICGILQSF